MADNDDNKPIAFPVQLSPKDIADIAQNALFAPKQPNKPLKPASLLGQLATTETAKVASGQISSDSLIKKLSETPITQKNNVSTQGAIEGKIQHEENTKKLIKPAHMDDPDTYIPAAPRKTGPVKQNHV